ncbi:hypothetical protein HanIR_Chr08g0376831 [Helianthus annuus]|nr:hypothetical protein HanIR_Chr08g0376831 [Helianthus annuus]
MLKLGYKKPTKDGGILLTLEEYNVTDVKNVSVEQKMIALLYQSVQDDIISLLDYDNTSKSLWEASEKKCVGGDEIVKNKPSLLKKEFDLFTCLKGENIRQMIERFGHLKLELERFGVYKENEEIIDRLIEALPNEILKNSNDTDACVAVYSFMYIISPFYPL